MFPFLCAQDRIASEILKRKKLPPRLKWSAIVLDMSNVSSIDSSSITILMEVASDVQRKDIGLCFTNVPQAVRRMCAVH